MALRPYHTLALCAGAGGLELGVELAVPGARCVAYVEREAYAAGTLVARMETGELAPAPVWSDLATFDARPWRGRVHCITSGDPCQDNSIAGRRLGSEGQRFLAPEVVRIADDCRPDRIFRENVTGNADEQLAAIAPALERLGYRVAAGVFSAAGIGASHRRERLFIMADRIGSGWRCPTRTDEARQPSLGEQSGPRRGECGGDAFGRPEVVGGRMDDAVRGRHINQGQALRTGRHGFVDAGGSAGEQLADAHVARSSLWPFAEVGRGTLGQEGQTIGAGCDILLCPGPADRRWPGIIARAPHLEPAVRRVADGLAHRVDRLRLCGNGVHPLAAGYAWAALDALLADAAASEPAVRAA